MLKQFKNSSYFKNAILSLIILADSEFYDAKLITSQGGFCFY